MKYSVQISKCVFHSFVSAVFYLIFCIPLAGQLWASQNHSVNDFTNMPINVVQEGVPPRVLINTSNDHQLYFKAYNDFSDLDNDGIAEISYKHSIDYYGYFDSSKCYKYDDTDERFEPDTITADKYCNAGVLTGQWSGNFLNWVAMSRIDAIRKVLFGGHRRVDTATDTVLERSYLPHDAHSWAKYYAEDDLPKLTPFDDSDYNCDKGDINDQGTPGDITDDTTVKVACQDGGNLDWKLVGVTFGNTTDVDMGNYGNNTFSEDYTEPPLIKVVKGNYSLWASNEGWQLTWSSGSPVENHGAQNANVPAVSGINAYPSGPAWSQRLGEGNYVARILACVTGKIGDENCKLYPGTDTLSGTADDIYKPVGLLQKYGDEEQMYFGMVAGSYGKHASGGVLIRNVDPMTDEVNVDSDGTFPLVAQYAGGPKTNNTAKGLINAWSLYRIIGYDGDRGYYNNNQGDNCKWGLYLFSDVTNDNRCQNWGNPFSEIYYQAINYFAGAGVIGDYRDNSSNVIPGLPTPQIFKDPLDDDSYCADLFVINLNSSTISYDADELDATNYGPSKIWDDAILPGDNSTSAMTDAVGNFEGIHSNDYFIGEINLGGGTDDQLCTSKEVTSFGETGGICPEAPRLRGSYRMAGLAYYSHVEDIRPATASGNQPLEGIQTIDTYSVALAAGIPVIDVPNPVDLRGDPLVTILPACQNTGPNGNRDNGNCALVDFKIVSQEIDIVGKTAKGKFYINWEDSEQGGDYDQDMWGTLSYEVDINANTVAITTEVHAQSTNFHMGFGYVIGGTDNDGFHAHSGIEGYIFADTADSGFPDCTGGCSCRSGFGACNVATTGGPSTKTYTLGTSTTKLLEDPLWYAAKYGGFTDSNDNKRPDLQEEWDSKINTTGQPGQDGIPDNFFLAANPRELEDSLTRVLNAILERTSSGTAAAVVSSNVRGEGALFQAYYEPVRKDLTDEASWIGTVQALWLDKYGFTRQDCTPPASNGIDGDDKCEDLSGTCVPNGRLDNYCVDQVVETYFDDLEKRTRMRIFNSDEPYTFTTYSMQGVVDSYTSGNVVMKPNSMEGMFNYNAGASTLSPYQIKGEVTAYDATNGFVDIEVLPGDWIGQDGTGFLGWDVTTDSSSASATTIASLILSAGPTHLTVSPAGAWIAVGDILTLKTKNLFGATGQYFGDWTVTCLEGATATGSINNGSIQLNNSKDSSAAVTADAGDFTTCTRARFLTYNMKGKAGNSYSSWEVSNLQTNQGRGTSTADITLTNSATLSFSVLPIDNWLTAGDQVLVANYTTTQKELYEIGYLWNAREELYLPGVSDAVLAVNRDYDNATANEGRFITTWIDTDNDKIIDTDERRAFETQIFTDPTTPVSFTFFDVANLAEAEDLVEYVRGIEKTGNRNRTIKYSLSDASTNVMRLGDIVNSTPTTVGAPAEAFDLLYKDLSYRPFRQQYIDRRIMVYSGGNDGMLHAFNGGFYNVDIVADKEIIEYSTSGKKFDGSTALAHPLGSEVWAYVPQNLLPHLQWLKDPGYSATHVSYMDAKPRVFDAKIFTAEGGCGTDPVGADCVHPNGWGTVMVVGMNLGGGEMTMDIDHDSNAATPDVEVKRRSAYVVMDITNPEQEPTVLAELTLPDNSFTTVYPAIVAFQDLSGETNCDGAECNDWYLLFGNGPDNLSTYESSQTGKMYLLDLKQLVTGAAAPDINATVPTSCTVDPLNASGYNILTCDTSIPNTFMGTPAVVDWDLDFRSNTAYFGLVGDDISATGRIMRFGFDNKGATASWDTNSPSTLYNTGRPMSAQPVPALDNLGNHWVFAGSGRYSSLGDKSSTATQGLFGIKDVYPTATGTLLDVTDAEIYTDGTLKISIPSTDGSTNLTTFDEIETEIDTNAGGWNLWLPPIIGTVTDPSTRNTTRSALLGGVLFSSVFQPSEDPCDGEGLSRLYGMFYKTGTAFPGVPPILGSKTETVSGEVKYLANRYIDLGRGAATAPAIHSGSGSGDSGIKVFTQLSTGEMIQSEAETVEKIRAGRTSWQDQ